MAKRIFNDRKLHMKGSYVTMFFQQDAAPATFC